jgi:ethanolamine permease
VDKNMSVSGVQYTHAGAEYFEKRGLKRYAGAGAIWGLGIAAVISGDFSGWNFGIGNAGWGGMLVATLIIGLMYVLMIYSISEMSAAMPHTGGAYSFARSAMGPWGGFVTGFAETLAYVITTAVVGTFAALYADAIFVDLFDVSLPILLWVVIIYVIFVALNTAGAAASFRFAFIIAIISLGVLAIFFVAALFSGKFSVDNLFDIVPEAGGSTFLPYGFLGIFLALPFAIWFFLGIEGLPLAAEETQDPAKDIPRGAVAGMFTLLATALLVLILNPGVVGSAAISESGEPILDGFRAIFPSSDIAALLSLMALAGLIASFQGIMFAAGRNVYSLSRAGYYPKFLSLTGARKTPYVALIASAVVGIALIFGLGAIAYGAEETPYVSAANALLLIAVFGAVIAYILQMVSFLILRRKFPNVSRPFRSPVGVVGALIAGIIAFVTLILMPFNADYRAVVVWVAVVYVIGLLLFAIFGRKRLVLSPEEEYAISGGVHGHPETEGYDVVETLEESGAEEFFPPKE